MKYSLKWWSHACSLTFLYLYLWRKLMPKGETYSWIIYFTTLIRRKVDFGSWHWMFLLFCKVTLLKFFNHKTIFVFPNFTLYDTCFQNICECVFMRYNICDKEIMEFLSHLRSFRFILISLLASTRANCFYCLSITHDNSKIKCF